MNRVTLLFLCAILFLSCASQREINNKQLIGNYLGELPCADCAGIKTSIQLFPDFTYHKKSLYLDKSDKIHTIKSSWKIINDSVLILNEYDNQQAYLYKKDKLVMLSQQSEIITGNLAYRYHLFKVTDGDIQKPDFSKLIKNDISVIGQGNEPFWSVELNLNQSLTLKQPGKEDIEFKIIESIYNKDISVFKATHNNTTVTFKIYNFPCVDDMSGSQADSYVEFQEQNKVLKGCGYILKQDFKLAGEWHVSYMKDYDLKKIVKESLPYINFQLDKKQLKGHLGCNSFGASYTIQNSNIIIEKMISTMMACPELIIEQKFSQALQNTTRFSLDGNTLNFFNQDSLLLSFTR